jgi:pyruvate dehydrogenase E2 component (dihydrolipoamide acetyltransferase)
MATTVEVPKLGNTVEDCLIATWRKHKGDTVSAGEVVAEIETDKTNFELTAPVDGVVLETFFEEGALVPVFTVICAIGSAGESSVGLGPENGDAGPGGVVDAGPADGPPAGTGGARAAGGAGHGAQASNRAPAARRAAANGQAHLSPRARRFSHEHDVGPGHVEGTGAGGRVLEADLQRAMHSSPRLGGPVPAPAFSSSALPEAPAPDAAAGGSGTAPAAPPPGADGAPMSSVRQRIAKRLRESLSTTAQYTLNSSANASDLLAVRKKMKATGPGSDININDLVVFCTIRALLEVPGVNAELVDGVLYRRGDVNMGFACDTDRGLVVPVVHRAQDLSLLGLSRRLKELAAQAGAGSTTLDDLSGASFTVSNLGALGIESFTPVLNPPQVAILGVGAIGLKGVRKADGNIEFIDSIGLSLTLDHQVVDGAPGARFLAVLRSKIEAAEALCTI